MIFEHRLKLGCPSILGDHTALRNQGSTPSRLKAVAPVGRIRKVRIRHSREGELYSGFGDRNRRRSAPAHLPPLVGATETRPHRRPGRTFPPLALVALWTPLPHA